MRIQHNIMALNSNRQLGSNNSAVSKSLEKLSSGYRINRAGDDAAGLAISEKMRAQIKGLTAATDNSQDAISLVQTAEGGLQEVHSMLNRMQELATKSANGTYTDDVDRKALQAEVSALKDEIDRICDGTDFNGIKLLDGTMGVGSTGFSATTTKGTAVSTTDKATTFNISAPEGYQVEVLTSAKTAASKAEWAGNKLTITLSGDASKTYTQKDIDDLLAAASGTPAEAVGKVKVTVDRDFKVGADGVGTLVTLDTAALAKAASASTADGKIKITADKAGVDTRTFKFSKVAAAGDPTGVTTKGNGDADIKLEIGKSYSADEINAMLENAGVKGAKVSFEGTMTSDELSTATAGGAAGVFLLGGGAGLSAGGGLTLQIGDTNDSYNQLNLSIADMHVSALGLTGLDISTREGASAAISKVKTAINQVSTTRGALGAVQNRLEHTINNLGVTTENITAAESRIRDVDMAKEMMEYTKNSVLVQSAQAMLAQANQQPQSVLQLLQ